MSENDPLGILSNKGTTNDPLGILSQDEVKKKVSSEDIGRDSKDIYKSVGTMSGLVKVPYSSSKSKSVDSGSESLSEKENRIKAEKFLGAGKYNEKQYDKTDFVKHDTNADVKLSQVVEDGNDISKDQIEFKKIDLPAITPKGFDKYLPKKETPKLTTEEVNATLDLYKDIPQEDEHQKVAFLQEGTPLSEGTLKGKTDESKANIRSFVEGQQQDNFRTITSKPTQEDRTNINSGVALHVRDLSGQNPTKESPDGTDTGYWLSEIDDYKNTGQVKSAMTEINGRMVDMPLPLRKAVEDYYFHLYKWDEPMYNMATSKDLTDRELMQVMTAAVDFQQKKLATEYKAKKGEGAFPVENEIYKPYSQTQWNDKSVLDASTFLSNVASDYFEKSGEGVASEFRDKRLEDVTDAVQQSLTDVQYQDYKESGGFFLNPIDGAYYNFAQPIKNSTMDFARGVLTLPRAVGLDKDFQIFDHIVKFGDEVFTPNELSVPSKIKDEGFTWNNALPKMIRGLADFGILIMGTKGLSAAGMSSKASLFTTSFVFSNDNNFNSAIDSGMSKEEAVLYSNITTSIQYALEFVSPNKNLTDGFYLNVTPKVIQDIAKGKAVNVAFKDRLKEWSKEIGQEEAQEFAQLFAEKGTNYLWNKTTGSRLNDDVTAAEMLETGIVTFAVTGLANAGKFRPTSDMSDIAIYQLAGADNSSREEIIRNEIEKKTITQEQGQNLIDKTNEYRKILAGVPSKYNPKQKMALSNKIYQLKVAEQQEKEIVVNPAFENEQPKTAEKLQEEINVLKEEYDSENKAGLQSDQSIREEPIEAKPVEEISSSQISPSGNVQASEEVINKSNINEKVNDQKGRQEGLLSTEEISPSIEGEIPDARPTEENESARWDEKLNSKLDEWENNLDEFSKGTLGINVPVVVAKGAIKTMKGFVKTAGTVQDIVQAGIDFVKTTDWYLSKGDNDRANIEDELRHDYSRKITAVKKAEEKVTEKQAKEVKRTEEKVAALILEDVDRGVKQMAKEQKDLGKEIEKVLKKPSIVTKLSLPQYKALINEARKVKTTEDLENYKSKVADILVKQNENNIAKEKKSVANKNRGTLKTKSKSKGIPVSDKDLFKALSFINPNQVEDIDMYNEITNSIISGNKSGQRQYTNEDVQKYIDGQIEYINENKKKKILEKEQELVDLGLLSDKMSLDEINSVLENADEYINSQKKDEKKKELKERKEAREKETKSEIKNEITEINKMVSEMKEAGTYEESFDEDEKKILDYIDKIDFTDIEIKDARKLLSVLNNINTNLSFANTGIISKIYAQQYGNDIVSDELAKLGMKDVPTYLDKYVGLFLRIARNVKVKMASVPNLIKAIAVNRDLTTKLRVATQTQDLMNGYAKTVSAMEDINKEFNSKIEDKDNSSPQSQAKQRYYADLSMAEDQEDFNRIKELIRQNAFISAKDSLWEAKRRGWINDEQYELLAESVDNQKVSPDEKIIDYADLKKNIPKGDFDNLLVYEKEVKDITSVDEIKLNPSEKKQVDFFMKIFNDIMPKFFSVTEIYNNVILQGEKNYTPTVYISTESSNKPKTEETLEQQIMGEAFMDKLVNRKPSGSTIAKTKPYIIPEGKKMSTNFQYDMMRKYREAVYQINTIEARNNIVAVLDNPEFVKMFGKENAELLKKNIALTVKSQMNILEQDALVTELYGLSTKAVRFGSAMVLGDWILGRIKQFAPGFLGASIKLGKNSELIYALPSIKESEKNIYKYSNLTERVNTKAGFQTESYKNEKEYAKLKSEFKKSIAKATGWTGEKLEWAANGMMSEITRGDVTLAKRVWLAYYADYKLRNGGTFNLDEEIKNPDKMATAHADQLIEETMSTNSHSNLPEILRRNRNMGDVAKNIIFPFSTYSVSNRVRISNSFKQARTGATKEEREEGLRDMGAALSEVMVFNTIRIGAAAMQIGAAYYLYLLAGLDEDEAEERAGEFDWEKVGKKFAGNTIKDFFISGIGAQGETYATQRMNDLYKLISGDDKDLVYSPSGEDLSVTDYWGSYGIVADKVMTTVSDVYKRFTPIKATKGGFKGKEEYFDKELTDEEKGVYNILIVNDIMNLMGFNQQQLNSSMDKVRRNMENWMEREYGGGESELVRGGKAFKNQNTESSGKGIQSKAKQTKVVSKKKL